MRADTSISLVCHIRSTNVTNRVDYHYFVHSCSKKRACPNYFPTFYNHDILLLFRPPYRSNFSRITRCRTLCVSGCLITCLTYNIFLMLSVLTAYLVFIIPFMMSMSVTQSIQLIVRSSLIQTTVEIAQISLK